MIGCGLGVREAAQRSLMRGGYDGVAARGAGLVKGLKTERGMEGE